MTIRLTPRTQSFENLSTQELIDLDNLLYNNFNTSKDWFDAFKDDEQIRIELIESINEKHKANNYDGPNDYYVMSWFAKGLNLLVPQKPKRYVDSYDYLLNNLHKLKHHDKLNDFKRKRIHEGFSDSRLNESPEFHKKKFHF